MKKITLVFILIAGCAAPNVAPDAKFGQLEESRHEIVARGKRCVLAVMKLSANQILSTEHEESPVEQERIAIRERDLEIAKCKAAEARDNEELSAQGRDEYVLQAQQIRDNATLITILSTSRAH